MINYDLLQLCKEAPNITITVTGADLLEMVKKCVSITKEGLEQTIRDSATESYLTPEKTAQHFDCNLSTLWRWNKSGYLKHIEIGGKRRYKMSDIQRLMEGGVK